MITLVNCFDLAKTAGQQLVSQLCYLIHRVEVSILTGCGATANSRLSNKCFYVWVILWGRKCPCYYNWIDWGRGIPFFLGLKNERVNVIFLRSLQKQFSSTDLGHRNSVFTQKTTLSDVKSRPYQRKRRERGHSWIQSSQLKKVFNEKKTEKNVFFV